MADEQAQQEQQGQPADVSSPQGGRQIDPAFFDAVNAYLTVTEEQSKKSGVKGASLAAMFASARLNAHVFLQNAKPINAAAERKDFLDYITTMYRRMLNEHLDGMGEERGIDVGDSELADDYRAAGVRIGRLKDGVEPNAGAATPAGDYVAAAAAVPPANE